MKTRVASTLLITLVNCSPLWAHPGHGDPVAGGIGEGALHALSGVDHLIVVGLIGWLAASLCGAARWQLLATFAGCLLLGAASGGMEGFHSFAHPAAVSVAILGIGLTLRHRTKRLGKFAITAISGAISGFAHASAFSGAPAAAGSMLGLFAVTALLLTAALLTSLSLQALASTHLSSPSLGRVDGEERAIGEGKTGIVDSLMLPKTPPRKLASVVADSPDGA